MLVKVKMKTHSDEFLALAKRSYNDAIILAGRDHSIEDYKALLTRLGAVVELFLKDHVYEGITTDGRSSA